MIHGGGRGFENQDELKKAWSQHRISLMLEDRGPGRRPFGFYFVDLKMPRAPFHWHEELLVLMEHKLIDATEAVRIDLSRTELGPKADETTWASFGNRETILQMRPDAHSLRQTAAGFEAAAEWHTWRGRLTVADLWAHRATLIREIIEEPKL